jgi:tyrosinase
MVAFSKPNSLVGMLFTVVVLLQAVAASNSHAQAHMMHKRATNIQCTGVTEGAAAPRLEIRELMKNADQWNLYLLAMENFQAKDKSDPMSYYQISGECSQMVTNRHLKTY